MFPIFSIISFVISFFLSKKAGLSNGQAALVAGAAGLATYTAIDPANPEAIWKPFHKDPASTNINGGMIPNPAYNPSLPDGPNNPREIAGDTSIKVTSPGKSVGDALSSIGTSTVDLVKDWGPGKTIGAVAGVSVMDRIVKGLRQVPPIVWVGVLGVAGYKIISK